MAVAQHHGIDAQNLGSGRSDAFQAGVYGTTRNGPAYLAAALAYTEHWMSTDRLAFAGDHLTADFDAQSFGGRIEAGYRIPVALWGLTPYAAVQAQNFHTPTYNETDITGGGFGLTYNAHNASDTRSELGARFDKPILINWNAVLALHGRVAWAHDWLPGVGSVRSIGLHVPLVLLKGVPWPNSTS
jgi:outer membrane autotransporter protein